MLFNDVWFNILLQSSIDVIVNMYLTCKQIKLITNTLFWRQKFKLDRLPLYSVAKAVKIGHYKDYINEYLCVYNIKVRVINIMNSLKDALYSAERNYRIIVNDFARMTILENDMAYQLLPAFLKKNIGCCKYVHIKMYKDHYEMGCFYVQNYYISNKTKMIVTQIELVTYLNKLLYCDPNLDYRIR